MNLFEMYGNRPHGKKDKVLYQLVPRVFSFSNIGTPVRVGPVAAILKNEKAKSQLLFRLKSLSMLGVPGRTIASADAELLSLFGFALPTRRMLQQEQALLKRATFGSFCCEE